MGKKREKVGPGAKTKKNKVVGPLRGKAKKGTQEGLYSIRWGFWGGVTRKGGGGGGCNDYY